MQDYHLSLSEAVLIMGIQMALKQGTFSIETTVSVYKHVLFLLK